MFDLLKKTPLYAIGSLIAAQLATMVPFISGGKIRPLFFVYLDEISLLDLTPTFCFAAGHALVVTALLLIARMLADKWGLRIVGGLVAIHFLGMIIGVLYYGNFGQYPRVRLC